MLPGGKKENLRRVVFNYDLKLGSELAFTLIDMKDN